MKVVTAVIYKDVLYVSEGGALESDPSPGRLETKLLQMSDLVVDIYAGTIVKNRCGPTTPHRSKERSDG